VPIQGLADLQPGDSLVITLLRSDGLLVRQAYGEGDFPTDSFQFSLGIEARLAHYAISAEFHTADSSWLLAKALNVVAGDIYVVQGQSNAQAIAFNGDANIWQNNFVRCFGNSNPEDYGHANWYVAEGNGYFTPGAVGQWALRMGQLIQAQHQIPVAIFNGADPGRPIEYFQRNDLLPDDSTTNYGRLLRRLRNAGALEHIRAVIYYQGESDGDRADIHKSLFEALYADWETDFPGVEAYYVVQVREGCGAPSLLLRDYQRQFQDYLPKLTSVTANGINGHDGCHYNVSGYQQLGEKMFKHLSAALYNAPSGQQLNVQILDAAYSNETNTQITLRTDADSLTAAPGSGLDFKVVGTGSFVTDIRTEGSQIILTLDVPVYDSTARLSYAGHATDAGAWVLNSDGYGLYTRYNLPVANHRDLPGYDIPGIMSGSGNCLAFDGADDRVYAGSVLGSSYTKEAWIWWTGGGVANNIISGAANTAFWAPNFGNGYYLSAGHNGAWFLVVDSLPLQPYEWTHVAVTYDASQAEMRLYKNGFQVAVAQQTPPHNDPEIYVGSYAGAFTFQGKIDEVRIWETARTNDEIRATMCSKLSGDEPGLRSYFRFDQLDGAFANNAAEGPAGVLQGYTTPSWQRSAAPIGTRSVYAYNDTAGLSLAFDDGDSVQVYLPVPPEFLHLYVVDEVPNVLEAPSGHVLVDHARYFGVHFPKSFTDSLAITCLFAENPFAGINENLLGLCNRSNNAQPFWEPDTMAILNLPGKYISTGTWSPGEFILALKENTLDTSPQYVDPGAVIYPNPVRHAFSIQAEGIKTMYLYDATGRLCLQRSMPFSEIATSALSDGVYFLKAYDRLGRVYQQRIVILKD
ncbi:MAG: LamG-like jellyroll fold domain-containing protein, partial [Saprospiraceae bacterium]|nr:LamG-like jellyroll fold domain-containing protein [Saprospiraceae bacterium]